MAAFACGADMAGLDLAESQADPSDQYDPTVEEQLPLRTSLWLIDHADVARIVARRRSRYTQWLQATATLPHCHALFPGLPDDCVPYMFALHIDNPGVHFIRLKLLGVPVWRWDNMGDSGCKVSQDYRLHLLQLPCHQELSEAEFAWMVRAVTAVLSMP